MSYTYDVSNSNKQIYAKTQHTCIYRLFHTTNIILSKMINTTIDIIHFIDLNSIFETKKIVIPEQKLINAYIYAIFETSILYRL